MNHPTRESTFLVKNIKTQLESLGLKVAIDAPVDASKLNLYMSRQFLGADPIDIMDLAINNFKSISDPNNILRKDIQTYKISGASVKKLLKIKICGALGGLGIVPIAIRKYAFFAKNKTLLDLYSTEGGYLYISRILRLMEE